MIASIVNSFSDLILDLFIAAFIVWIFGDFIMDVLDDTIGHFPNTSFGQWYLHARGLIKKPKVKKQKEDEE